MMMSTFYATLLYCAWVSPAASDKLELTTEQILTDVGHGSYYYDVSETKPASIGIIPKWAFPIDNPCY